MSNNVKELSAQQVQVIGLLTSGTTQREAAAAVGLAEETISRWANHDPVFIAAYNAGLRSLHEATAAELHALRLAAVRTLAEAVNDDNPRHSQRRLAAAIAALKIPLPPVGSSHPADIAQMLTDADGAREARARGLFAFTTG